MNFYRLVISITFVNSVNCNFFTRFSNVGLADFDIKSLIFTNSGSGLAGQLLNKHGGMYNFSYLGLLKLSYRFQTMHEYSHNSCV